MPKKKAKTIKIRELPPRMREIPEEKPVIAPTLQSEIHEESLEEKIDVPTSEKAFTAPVLHADSLEEAAQQENPQNAGEDMQTRTRNDATQRNKPRELYGNTRSNRLYEGGTRGSRELYGETRNSYTESTQDTKPTDDALRTMSEREQREDREQRESERLLRSTSGQFDDSRANEMRTQYEIRPADERSRKKSQW